MRVEVEMRAFGSNELRIVDIPDSEINDSTINDILENVFRFGQNDFQPKQQRSVSVGDVIRLFDMKYEVDTIGFKKIR